MSARNDPREAALVKQIMAVLRATPGVVVRKRHGTAMGVAGDPDIYGSFCGRHFEIEVKRRDGVLTELQKVRIRDWTRAGALVGVAHSAAEALSLLELDRGGPAR
mgnify:CR=1 FL=1